MKSTDVRAAAFLSTEGVNLGGLLSFALSSQISELQYLGVSNVRAGWATPGASGYDSVLQMASLAAAAGVKFDLVDEQVGSDGTLQPNAQLANYDALEAAAPGSIASIEGLNEVNNQPISYGGSGSTGQGQDELNAAIAYQHTIYRQVTSDPALAGVGVDYFTGYAAGSIPSGPDPAKTAGLATADTQHPYPNFGEAPAQWVDPAVAFGNLTATDIANGARMVYTETGYSSVPTPGGSGVDEATQARYTLDLLLDDAQNGIATTYLYDINDDGPAGSSSDDGFGLFYALDNSADPGGAKPVATAIHNMNAILADSGATATSFTPDPVAYAVNDLTATSNDMEIQKSDGTSIIALWDEQPIWNSQTNTEIAPTVHDEIITLGNGGSLYNVAVYDPLIGAAPIQTASNVSALTVAMSSDPLFLKLTPAATATTTLATAATTASDTVVLNLGEAQHDGVDATFSVSIDGAVVGTGTVTAAEAGGASDNFTYTGNFGTGTLDVVVSMLDGFTGNVADMGRTLYVNSVSVNGQANFENTIDEYDNPETYALTVSPAVTPPAEATPDTLTLNLSDTALNGQDALFAVAVNGTLVSEPMLVTAAAGGSQNFTFTGDFGSKATVKVDFINGYTGGAYGEELVVNSITLDAAATKENADLYYNGATSYTVTAGSTTTPTTPPAPVTPTLPTTPLPPSSPTIAPDTVVLNLGETQHDGVDATFSVSIDGAVVGTGTVTAAEAAGASDNFTYTGNFGTGTLDVVVSMLDGFTGNVADMGRTLYVNSVSVNGQANFENTIDEYDNPETYALTASPAVTPPAETTPDTLTLNLSDTALNGQDALFAVAVNGTLVSQPMLVTAAAGGSQNFTFTGDFGSKATVKVDFINGYTGGAYGEELVVNSITLDGAATKENADLYYNGATSYTVAAGSTTTPTTPPAPVTPTTPVTPTPPVTTPTAPTKPATPSGATISMAQYAAPATSGVLATPLETDNWTPQMQLAGFLSAAAAGTASILFMGDSTTAGVGSNPTNSADTAGGTPDETAYWLNQDGIAAQAASVLGVNNNGASEQLTFADGATINGAASVDGPTPLLQGKGASETFTPDDPIVANQIEAQVYGGGTNTIEVTVNGTVAGTITASDDGLFDNDTLQLAQAETINSVAFVNEGTGGQYIEGVETNNTASKAIKVLNAGVSGGTAVATNYQEQYGDFPPEAASTVPNVLALDPSLVVLDYGINDMNFGESVATFISAISGIVSSLQAAHIDVVLMSPTPFNDNGGGAAQEAQLVSALGALAVADNIPFIDLNDTYGGAGAVAALTSAGFFSTSPGAPHPSAEAYANIGQGIAGLLAKAIDASGGTTPTTPAAPTTPTTPATPASHTSAINALPPADPASTGGIGANPLVTYNWNPAIQLASFIADPTGSSVAFVGDSTTLGFGGTANDEDYVGTAAMPAEVTSYLNEDGIAAQDDNFEGQGNELGTTPDPRVALVGGAQWSFPMLAGGELVATAKAGDGVTFTPLTPTDYTTATISYLSLGGGTLDVSVNGGPAFETIALGNSDTVASQTVDLPTGTPISSITATQAGGTADNIEGISLSGASTQAAQIYDLGVGGAESSLVGAGSDATGAYTVTPISASTVLDPTVVFINYGINDMLQGNLTAAQTTANIGLAVKQYQAAGSEPVIVMPQAIDSANYAPEIATLQGDIDALAKQYNVPVIDLSATYGTSWQTLSGAGLMSDYAHPDGTFYSDIGKGIAGLLAAAVHQG